MPPEAMHVLEDIIIGLITATTIVLIAYSPIARAIGNRILHGRIPPPGTPVRDDGRVDDLSGEVAALRHVIEEQQERLDFAERMIAQQREPRHLAPGRDD